MDKKELGSLIQRSLGVRQISYAEAAKFLHLNPCAISHWCSGRYMPSIPNQCKLLAYLDEEDKNFKENPVKLLNKTHFEGWNKTRKATKQAILKKNSQKNKKDLTTNE